MNDSDLLQRYAQTGCESAFAEVVSRNVNLVFSAALRQVNGDHHLAEDVTQAVFSDLARNARKLAGRIVLSGWLYTSTRYAAANRVRSEQRRLVREKEAFDMQATSKEPPLAEGTPDWNQLESVLDEAMHDLHESDRNAVLLRYFEGRNYGDVGAKLGLSQDAARMRVDRALEKLRKLLGKRGISSSTAALAAVISQQALTAAPAGLATSITTTALAGATATGGTTALTLLQIMGTTKLKMGVIALAVAAASVPIALQHRTQHALALKNEELNRANTELAAEIEPLKAENARLVNMLAQSNQSTDRSNELYRLRGEVTRLREENREAARPRATQTPAAPEDPIHNTLRTLGQRATMLKNRLNEMPDKSIPELQYLNDKDWVDAVGNMTQLESDEDYRQALSNLRARAKGTVGSQLQKALKKFAEANGETLPTDITQLQAYLEKPLDPSVLQRYQMVRTGSLNEVTRQDTLIAEVAPPVDDEYDTRFKFHLNGTSSTSFSKTGEALEAATEAFAANNNGALPRDPGQLAAYLQSPVDPARIQKHLAKIPPDITTLEQMKAKRR